MARRGHSTVVGKFAKVYHDRRKSEIRVFGELLRHEQLLKQNGPDDARR